MKVYKIFLVFLFFFFQIQTVDAFLEKVDGLEYVVRKIEEPMTDQYISKRFDLYEIYFENRSDKTFSIPGYSIDVGVDYSGVSDILSFAKDKSSKKLAIFNIAAGAASVALGGIVKSATNTVRSVTSYRKNNSNINNNEKKFLSVNRTYVIYPNEGLSLFFFLDKFSGQTPTLIRYICHDEVQNINYVVINENLDLREINAKNDNSNEPSKNDTSKNVIAVPDSNQYK